MSGRERMRKGALHRRALEAAGERVAWLLGPQQDPEPDLDALLHPLQKLGPAGMVALFAKFGLGRLARDIFLLVAAPELGPKAAAALAAHPLALNGRATPALIDLVLGPGAMAEIGPVSHLRRAALIDIAPGPGLAQRGLSVGAAVAQYIHDAPQPDEALAPALTPLADPDPPADPDAGLLARAVRDARTRTPQPVLFLRERRRLEAERHAAGAFAALGLRAFALDTEVLDLPPDRLAALLNRDAVFLEAGVVVPQTPVSAWLADLVSAPLIVWGETPPSCRRPVAEHAPAAPVRRSDGLVLAAADRQDAEATFQMGFAPSVWTTARARAAAGLSGLAERIEPQARFTDLVLPEAQLAQLKQMAAFRTYRRQVLDDWGFRAKSSRGLGLAALFSGPSGTGKTMAAEIVAAALGPGDEALALYRVDLSAVVSKYIGETEKNIGRIFDAAEGSDAVLIFDEGEALFGKRTTDVKDSLDRHANTETAYLLQRLESYSGCAIVTTNLKGTVDEAFLRRFRVVIDFPFPSAELRARIWRSVFPAESPTDGLDVQALARLAVSGGMIRSIALTAAFLAAAEGRPVDMAHLERAVRQEYGKLAKPLSEAELRGFR